METSHAIRVFMLLAAITAVACASGIEGQVLATGGTLPANLSVQVYSEGRFVDTFHVNDDGSFRARNLGSGNFEFRVVNPHGDTVRTEYVTLGSYTGTLELRVPGFRTDRPASGTVSVKALVAKIPRDARKAMERSDRAFQKGDLRESIALLKQARDSCRDCVQVHNNLGTRYMRTGAFTEAAQAFRRAVELDPHSVTTQGNLAIALITLRDFAAAEVPARKAYDLDRTFVPTRYALGLIALAKRSCTEDTVDHLRAAAAVYPRARLSLASALVCCGDNKSAVDELTAYLTEPKAEHRDKVERWRAELSAGLQ